MQQITNITQLRDDLLDNYSQLKENKLDVKNAKELANTAGKILTSIKVQLEYNTMRGNKDRIQFLEGI